MSDLVYDYAYVPVIRGPVVEEVNKIAASCPEIVVNTDDFSNRDLQLFVDSMEIITRLKRAKYEERQNRRIEKYLESFENSKKIITCLDDTLDEGEVVKSSFHSESGYMNDDTIYATTNQDESHVLYTNIISNSLQSCTTNSGESGVYLDSTMESHVYENIYVVGPRPRYCQIITPTKNKSLKSRLVALIRRRQYVKPVAAVEDQLASDDSDIYEAVLDDIKQRKFTKNTKKVKKTHHHLPKKQQPAASSGEESFFKKAMGYLALGKQSKHQPNKSDEMNFPYAIQADINVTHTFLN